MATIVYLGLGSNIDNKELNLKTAIKEIALLEKTSVKAFSSLYETEPYGLKNQPFFLNAAIKISTQFLPLELLKELKQIEEKMGRKKNIEWGPRIIDLDILLYGNLFLNNKNLIIPHPLLHQRLFVLLPLNEIASYVIHPIIRKSIGTLLKELKKNKKGEKCTKGNISLLKVLLA